MTHFPATNESPKWIAPSYNNRTAQRLRRMKHAALLLGCLCALYTVAAAQSTDQLPRRDVLGVAVIIRDGSVVVGRVLPESAASAAGIKEGDTVLSVNGASITSVAQFMNAVRRPAGASINLTLLRNRVELSENIVLPPAPREHLSNVQTLYGTVLVDGALRRTLTTIPVPARGRLPGVLLVGGIGCYSIDNTFDQLDPYRHLVADLSKADFITMRVEKSGVGDSEGAPCSQVDFRLEYDGYAAGLAALKADRRVDSAKVFIIGHSIGGVIAPRLALGGKAAGIVVADTVGIDWFTYEMINERRQAVLDGLNPEQVDADAAVKEFCMHELLIAKKNSQQVNSENKDCATPPYPASDAYMQELAALNIAAPWMKVDVPVLALYGRADFITDESDQRRIVEIVNSSHPGRATFMPLDNMDHYLAVADSQRASFDRVVQGRLESTYNEAFSQTIIKWLKSIE